MDASSDVSPALTRRSAGWSAGTGTARGATGVATTSGSAGGAAQASCGPDGREVTAAPSACRPCLRRNEAHQTRAAAGASSWSTTE